MCIAKLKRCHMCVQCLVSHFAGCVAGRFFFENVVSKVAQQRRLRLVS